MVFELHSMWIRAWRCLPTCSSHPLRKKRMTSPSHEVITLQSESDVVIARKTVKEWSVKLGFSLVEQTKLITAASELARNAIVYGKGGAMTAEIVQKGVKQGLRLTFEDSGPGIPDIELAFKDGYTSGTGLGLGLGGARRLVDEFEILSEVGKGTRVTVTRWK